MACQCRLTSSKVHAPEVVPDGTLIAIRDQLELRGWTYAWTFRLIPAKIREYSRETAAQVFSPFAHGYETCHPERWRIRSAYRTASTTQGAGDASQLGMRPDG